MPKLGTRVFACRLGVTTPMAHRPCRTCGTRLPGRSVALHMGLTKWLTSHPAPPGDTLRWKAGTTPALNTSKSTPPIDDTWRSRESERLKQGTSYPTREAILPTPVKSWARTDAPGGAVRVLALPVRGAHKVALRKGGDVAGRRHLRAASAKRGLDRRGRAAGQGARVSRGSANPRGRAHMLNLFVNQTV